MPLFLFLHIMRQLAVSFFFLSYGVLPMSEILADLKGERPLMCLPQLEVRCTR
jgi:hypothetical protein